ncbi:MAG: murein biosynthesis integral membrane protein MurJ [Acidimicrobiales bacterium]
MTMGVGGGTDPGIGIGRQRLMGATAAMAVGTTLSRITGLARVIALAAALGSLGFADAYNLANTTPNIVVDLVLTGVLAATFVPVFADRIATRNSDEAWEAISAVATVTTVVIVAATVAFFVLTPDIVRLYTVNNRNPDVHEQQAVAVFLLRWFVPQLAGYGLIALFTALLNTRGRFAAPMFVPVANNVVVILVLVWFHVLVPHPDLASIAAHHRGLVLLGLGTTLGVVVQAALLVPSLLRADLHLRFRWKPRHEAMRTIARLGGWTFGWVVANQVALFIVLALADGAEPGTVSAYTYSYQFFLLPYGVVTVSIMSAVTPVLSVRWAQRDTFGFRYRMAYGLRGMLAIIIPSTVGMLILAHPLIDLVLAHGTTTRLDAQATASSLAMLSLGLPGFCIFLYMIRVFQSMQDTRSAFRIYVVENAINVVVAVALVRPLGVRGLALSISIAYTLSAVLALVIVRRRIGGLGGNELVTPLKRVIASSAVMAVAIVIAINVSGARSGPYLLGRVAFAIVIGFLVYVGTATWLGARHARRHPRARSGSTPTGSMNGPIDGERRWGTGGGSTVQPAEEHFHGKLDALNGTPPHRQIPRLSGPRGASGNPLKVEPPPKPGEQTR